MKIKRPLIILITSGLFVAFMITVLYRNNKNSGYDLHLIRTKGGWGYTISRNNELIIYQEYMPGLQGKIAFSDRGKAKKTGKLVIEKMIRNQRPSITKEELDSIVNIDK
jgi:hypothetical protein